MKELERVRVLYSIMRFIAGLSPSHGRKHYFERLAVAECIKARLPRIDGYTCPFCGFRAKTKSVLVSHVKARHRGDLEALIRSCYEEVRAKRSGGYSSEGNGGGEREAPQG